MLEINNLSVIKQGKSLLKNISMNVPRAGVHAIIGANGAGKTTLLKSLAMLIETEGTLKYENELASNIDPDKRAKLLTYCGQSEFRDSLMTVNDIISYSRFGDKEDINLKNTLLEKFELYDLVDRPLASLSGGEGQRVNLLCSLYQNSQYVFWDEPTNFLDPKHVDLLEELVTHFSQMKSFLIVSHDLNFLMDISDHIFALKNGEIIFESSKKDVFDDKKLDNVFEKKFSYFKDNQRFIVR